jgi:histidinol-phosphate/aromatic aminotransferase/cobyric acid decarboxylase-like protein
VKSAIRTKPIHGGALWQPRIRSTGDYDSIVMADVNDAWYPPAPRVLETIAEWTPRVHHSPDSSGTSLLEAIARHDNVPVESIRLGAGSSDLLHHIISSSVAGGDEVLTLDPTYSEYRRVALQAGASVRAIDFERLDQSKPRLIALCNPNNPTGSVLTREELLRVVHAVPRHTYVLIDEAYIDFAPDESLLREAPNIENLVVVRTFSKAYALAGLRVGYAVMGERVRDLLERRGHAPWPVGLLGLRAAEVALEEDCHVRQRVAEYDELKRSLIASVPFPVLPSATHFFLADLKGSGVIASDVIAHMAERGTYLRDLTGFTIRDLNRFVRITTQGPEDNLRIAKAFQELQP